MQGRLYNRQDESGVGSRRKTRGFIFVSCLSWQQPAASYSDPPFGGRYKTFLIFGSHLGIRSRTHLWSISEEVLGLNLELIWSV